jgi:septal ring factor EnvC (AmiA/AmiB activator)
MNGGPMVVNTNQPFQINGVSQSPVVGRRLMSRKSTGGPAPPATQSYGNAEDTSALEILQQDLGNCQRQLQQERQNMQRVKAVAAHYEKQVKDAKAELQLKHQQNENLSRQLQREKERQRTQVSALEGENESLKLQLQEKDLALAKLGSRSTTGAGSGAPSASAGSSKRNNDTPVTAVDEDDDEDGMGIGSPAFLRYLRQHSSAVNGADTFTM